MVSVFSYTYAEVKITSFQLMGEVCAMHLFQHFIMSERCTSFKSCQKIFWEMFLEMKCIITEQNTNTADKLNTARNIQTNLELLVPASFDGTQDITPGIMGTLPILHGGTGATDIATARTNLDVYSKAEVDAMALSPSVSFDWGSQDAIGDAQWWTSLQAALPNMTAAERQDCLGKTKKVRLSSPVLGANAALMRCIGVDQDAPNTLTFQTAGSLPTTTMFSPQNSNGLWIGSTARTLCQNFYTYCSAHDAIKSVIKGTCTTQSDGRNASSVSYNTETVWLPSELEMGLDSQSALSVANSTTSKAECTQGKKISYAYYVDNTSRMKYVMDSDGNVGTNTSWYWERGRYYNTSGPDYVCAVYGGGSAGWNYCYGSYSLAPAFVVG